MQHWPNAHVSPPITSGSNAGLGTTKTGEAVVVFVDWRVDDIVKVGAMGLSEELTTRFSFTAFFSFACQPRNNVSFFFQPRENEGAVVRGETRQKGTPTSRWIRVVWICGGSSCIQPFRNCPGKAKNDPPNLEVRPSEIVHVIIPPTTATTDQWRMSTHKVKTHQTNKNSFVLHFL